MVLYLFSFLWGVFTKDKYFNVNKTSNAIFTSKLKVIHYCYASLYLQYFYNYECFYYGN